MSLRRLAATSAVMAAAAALLAALTPDLPDLALLGDPQAFVDAAGPETSVLAGTALLAWAAWGWGVLGLLLTALTAVPGVVGVVARRTGRVLLPAGARQAAAVALGVGLVVGTPALTGGATTAEPPAVAAAEPPVTAAASPAAPVPDWPTAPAPDTPAGAVAATSPPAAPAPVPDWPAGEHVVLRGDSLWTIAAADLRARGGGEPCDADVARAVQDWWTANVDVIGPDPDLLLPGQVLRAPASPTVPSESESQE